MLRSDLLNSYSSLESLLITKSKYSIVKETMCAERTLSLRRCFRGRVLVHYDDVRAMKTGIRAVGAAPKE